MKIHNLVRGLVPSLLLLATLGLTATECQAQAVNEKTISEIQSVLTKHDESLNQHNVAGLMALYAPDSKTVMMGTGPGEKWQGIEEIRGAYGEIIKDFDKGSLSHSCYWRTGGVSANVNMAWLAAMCKMGDAKQGQRREYELNVSGTLEKIGGKWLIRSIHFSNLTGGEK